MIRDPLINWTNIPTMTVQHCNYLGSEDTDIDN